MIEGQEKLQGKTNCRVGPLCVDHIIFENINIKQTLNKKYPQLFFFFFLKKDFTLKLPL